MAWLAGMPSGLALESTTTAIAFGSQLEVGELAEARAVVADRADTVDVTQHPAQAEGIGHGAGAQFDRGSAHPMQDVGRQHRLAVFAAAVAQMESAPAQQIRDRGAQPATGVVGAAALPGPRDLQRPVLAALVPGGEAAGHHIALEVEALAQPDRRENRFGDHLFERLTGHLLDDAAEQVEARLAVGRPLARRGDQRQVHERRDEGG
ncbi:hypothetical protein GCM10010198_01690 [Nocardia seriolae]|nr:hypothetical protein NSERKGN1266_23460 [Nocardia seriolae]BEK97599.1 hypothetical protein NSER024013_55050 [Nocardia seriolae]GEM27180.1 hypothetical protein NS2_54190 [Nocardia seriolae NBRC 15557]